MAKRTTSKRKQTPSNKVSIPSSASKDINYKEAVKNFITSPAVKYVAGGIATAMLARLATNMSERYPELSSFIKENLDNVEDKLGEFKSGYNESSSSKH